MSSLTRTPRISVVIRSREEERHLKTLISQIRYQTIKNTEIILVIDYSDSQTLRGLRRLRADKVVSLSHNEFNHAYSTNLGVAASRGELVAITNGHSLPISNSWLEAAATHFENPKVAGVTGLSTPFSDGSAWEKLYFTPVNIKLYRKKWLLSLLYRLGPHMFSTTNCMIRRSLWTEYPFDETLLQCEDYDWGVEMRARGYLTPIDPEFSVYHSHGDGLGVFLSRLKKWEILKARITTRTRPRLSHTRLDTSVPIKPQELMNIAG
jgi:glycosyltransferase involved in cell wall biosynthesis